MVNLEPTNLETESLEFIDLSGFFDLKLLSESKLSFPNIINSDSLWVLLLNDQLQAESFQNKIDIQSLFKLGSKIVVSFFKKLLAY